MFVLDLAQIIARLGQGTSSATNSASRPLWIIVGAPQKAPVINQILYTEGASLDQWCIPPALHETNLDSHLDDRITTTEPTPTGTSHLLSHSPAAGPTSHRNLDHPNRFSIATNPMR